MSRCTFSSILRHTITGVSGDTVRSSSHQSTPASSRISVSHNTSPSPSPRGIIHEESSSLMPMPPLPPMSPRDRACCFFVKRSAACWLEPFGGRGLCVLVCTKGARWEENERGVV